MHENFTEYALQALKLAKRAARSCNYGYIGTEHILLGLLQEERGTAGIVLKECGVDEEELRSFIQTLISPDGENAVVSWKLEYTPKAQALLNNSIEERNFLNMGETGTEHILMALIKDVECVGAKLLHTMGINFQKVYMSLLDAMGINDEHLRESIVGTRGYGRSAYPTLEQYGTDLTEKAENGELDPIVGREKEIQRLIQILSRRTKNNPCLIGEPGVGKTAIVEGLAQRISADAVPDVLLGKRVISMDMASMVAGSKYRGEFEERMKRLIQEVSENQEILLFIDEVHTIIGAGGAEGALDASNILKPALSRGEIQLIGATTAEEYRKYIEKDPALERRFQPILVEEPTEETAIDILKVLRTNYEEFHGVRISDEAVSAAVKLSIRYINDRFLPDKAIDLMDEAASAKKLYHGNSHEEIQQIQQEIGRLQKEKEDAIRMESWPEAAAIQTDQAALEEKRKKLKERQNRQFQKKNFVIQEADIAKVVSVWSKIPVEKLTEKESQRLLRLEKILHQRVVGQEEAVLAVSKAVKRSRVGLKDPNHPIGSFLFLGPTGVGKTELSKALAEAVFGSEHAMIRVDMSEYMEKHSVSKLVGSPPGYVGYEEGGQLSEKVRRHPYSVILFDEIEKAHPDVFNILLQVLDDGHITDAQGRKVDFKNTIIIMTSNAGAQAIIAPKRLGFSAAEDENKTYEYMKAGVMEEVRRIFKPEFLNRIDEIIVFHSLNKEHIQKIAGILCKEFAKRCKEQMNLELIIRDPVKEYISEAGFDAKYGARPLKRAIQTKLEDSLAEEILEGRIQAGDTVVVKMNKKEINFVKKSDHVEK